MPVTYPSLSLQQEFGHDYYRSVEGPWPLPYEEWVPLISAIHEAKTVRAQRDALTYGIFAVAGYTDRLLAVADERVETRLRHLKARFSVTLDPGTEPSLRFVRAGFVDAACEVGYRTSQNTVVITSDLDGRELHQDADEPLGRAGMHLSRLAVDAVAGQLHYWYPGFNIAQRLTEAGIQFPPSL